MTQRDKGLRVYIVYTTPKYHGNTLGGDKAGHGKREAWKTLSASWSPPITTCDGIYCVCLNSYVEAYPQYLRK